MEHLTRQKLRKYCISYEKPILPLRNDKIMANHLDSYILIIYKV